MMPIVTVLCLNSNISRVILCEISSGQYLADIIFLKSAILPFDDSSCLADFKQETWSGGDMELEPVPIRFISESVVVYFDTPPVLEKKPDCPSGFTWRGEAFQIVATLSEWVDHQRRGRAARNMRPTHASVAQVRGSWGVGQYYFRVVTQNGRIFDLYYDRAPKDADHRKGSWYLFQELSPGEQASQ